MWRCNPQVELVSQEASQRILEKFTTFFMFTLLKTRGSETISIGEAPCMLASLCLFHPIASMKFLLSSVCDDNSNSIPNLSATIKGSGDTSK